VSGSIIRRALALTEFSVLMLQTNVHTSSCLDMQQKSMNFIFRLPIQTGCILHLVTVHYGSGT